MTLRKYITIGFAIVLVFLLIKMILYVMEFNKDLQRSHKENPMNLTEAIPDEYISVFNLVDKISSVKTLESRLRRPIVNLTYDKKYYIEIYNIDTLIKSSLKDFIIESYNNAERTDDVLYTGDNPTTPFRINFKTLAPDKIESIYFNIYGDRTETYIKNDTTAVYYSSFKNFNIKFNKGSAQEIYCRPNKVDSLPIVVAFLKKRERLYLIIVSPKTKAVELNYDIIKDIIKLG